MIGLVPPRATVAMTTCNSARFLRDQLESIARQSVLPSGLVVADDASEDETKAILAEFSRSSPFPVEVVSSSSRRGFHANSDTALLRASQLGDIVVLADHDDVWESRKVETLVSRFASDHSLSIWCSDAVLIDVDGDLTSGTLFEMVHLDAAARDLLRSGGALTRLVRGETLTGPTMALRSDVAGAAVPTPTTQAGHDVLFAPDGWIAVMGALLGGIMVEEDLLTRYRRHSGQMSDVGASDHPPPTRRADLARHTAAVTLIADRVRARPEMPWSAQGVRELFALEDFLLARSLGRGTPGRAASLWGHARRGNYRRFASGWRTLGLDLIR